VIKISGWIKTQGSEFGSGFIFSIRARMQSSAMFRLRKSELETLNPEL